MKFLCHIRLDSYQDQDDQISPYEEYFGIIEAESREGAVSACEKEVGAWNKHRASISVAQFGQFVQTK